MPRRKNSEDMTGSTFADLYDVQEELSRHSRSRMGRPKNKIQRNPTTVYLTKDENRMLRQLQMSIGEHVSSVNRSQIIGIAIELMTDLIAAHEDETELFEGARSLDAIKRRLRDYLMA